MSISTYFYSIIKFPGWKKLKKKNKAIIINITIIILEIIGLILSIIENKRLLLEYYTIDSNILALISSILFLIDSFKYKRKITGKTKILKYTTCVSLALTMFMVLFILVPFSSFNTDLLFKGAMPIHHIICPILTVISFLFYEKYKFDENDKFQVLFFTFVYGSILIVLNLLGLILGPYPFLLVKTNPIIISIISLITIFLITYSFGLLLQKLKKRFY